MVSTLLRASAMFHLSYLSIVLALASCTLATDDHDGVDAQLAATWRFRPSEITGGGLANQIAIDPQNPAAATVGGDSWGLYKTANRGEAWFGAMQAGGTRETKFDGSRGQYYNTGVAYSRVDADTVYSLVGRPNDADGGFLVVRGQTVVRYVPGSATTPSGAEPDWNRHDHPRPKGKLVVDFDAASGTEYVYAAGRGGIFRSTDRGASWTKLALAGRTNEFVTGIAVDPANSDRLVVTTKEAPNAQAVSVGHAYILAGVRTGTVRVTTVALGGLQLEAITRVGGTLWAAARKNGVVRSVDGGAHWSVVFDGRGDDLTALGGHGSLLLAACTSANTGNATRACMYRSTDAGVSWTAPFAGGADSTEWGTDQAWWHAGASDPTTNSYVANDIAVASDDTVYLAGRAGVWVSRDAGASFRPAIYGLNGTMHERLGVAGNRIYVDDVDFDCESSPISAHFEDASQIRTHAKADCVLTPTGTLRATGGGHAVFVTAPTPDGAPARFYVDCPGDALARCTAANDRATPYFRGTVIRPTDVAFAGGYFFIAQFGGGLIVVEPPSS